MFKCGSLQFEINPNVCNAGIDMPCQFCYNLEFRGEPDQHKYIHQDFIHQII